ncbi:hypothetical protein N656DRAFT_182149 [Canariomyces notabilis]|uniref:Uncharacterized protein n=1 Tax=Canariomyces notabilis TaxID=2074819 RepID=A0AAN6QJW7_9PEZI|nr:hypothetical protein N656DRAFT_182149 [Canariomyces arenarius]
MGLKERKGLGSRHQEALLPAYTQSPYCTLFLLLGGCCYPRKSYGESICNTQARECRMNPRDRTAPDARNKLHLSGNLHLAEPTQQPTSPQCLTSYDNRRGRRDDAHALRHRASSEVVCGSDEHPLGG